jgi:hypothetical protein
MRALGGFLQFLGLVIVPMALIYYWRNQGREDEARLMFGELTILLVGATVFLLGKTISRR